MSSPRQRLCNRKQKHADPQASPYGAKHRVPTRADRLASTRGSVQVLTVRGSAVFSNSKASSFHSSASHRRHLSKSLSWLNADWMRRGSLGPVDIWRHLSVMRVQVAVTAAWLDADTWWWKLKLLGKTIVFIRSINKKNRSLALIFLCTFNCATNLIKWGLLWVPLSTLNYNQCFWLGIINININIRFISHKMTTWERILKARLWREGIMSDQQYCSTDVEQIALRVLLEK